MDLPQIETDAPRGLIAHAVPVLFLLGSLLAGRPSLGVKTSWTLAKGFCVLTWIASLGALAAATVEVSGGGLEAGRAGLVQGLVLALVGFLGFVLSRYSATYLDGEQNQQSFVRWFLATLAGSSLVVATDHLVVLAIAWLATSFALQKLLIFYGERTAARMAAYKKFLACRSADICVVLAALLFALGASTVEISALGAAELEVPVVLGMLLIAIAVVLKSAQLPVHGWLMQVMEAPTPVSALLHAGVVNLGGFILIRFAPLLERVPMAQALLILVGGTTAVLAGLILTTRISIKVALAWSTCAQMGFMIVQCGLGLYEMALLHLIGHSLYKAHAFLAAGGTVAKARVKAMATPTEPSTRGQVFGTAFTSIVVVLGAAFLLGVSPAEEPGLTAMAVVVALAVHPLLNKPIGVVQSLAVVLAYFGLHKLAMPLSPVAGEPGGVERVRVLLSAFLALGFLILFWVQHSGLWQSRTPRSQRLQAKFHGGLFLDEWFTRLTLRIFPVRTGDPR